MMELLKRFEEDTTNDNQAFLDDSDEEDDDLASKLESINLGKLHIPNQGQQAQRCTQEMPHTKKCGPH